MYTVASYPIEPLHISFRQLKTILPSTAGKEIPDAKVLETRKEGLLFTHELSGLTVTVYKDGFFLWRDDSDSIALAVDRCKFLRCKDPEGLTRIVWEPEFLDAPCLVPLIMAGDQQMVRVPEDYEIYWHEFFSRCEE